MSKATVSVTTPFDLMKSFQSEQKAGVELEATVSIRRKFPDGSASVERFRLTKAGRLVATVTPITKD